MQGKIETRVGIFVLAALAVFVYMGFHIGAFRFDRANYNTYTLNFKDISGLSRKADVKIAGVKVGWVENVTLSADEQMQAQAEIMIRKEYVLYGDSHAMVRQEGFLGPKFIEIIPGDPLLQQLQSGDSLGRPSQEPVSVDELFHQFKKIATHVEDVTQSFKEVVGSHDGREQLHTMFDNLSNTAQRLSSFSEVLSKSFVRNEANLDALLGVGSGIHHITQKIESTATAFEDASLQARDGLRSISSVAEKIDEGKGLVGKLINEDETYRDLKIAVQGFKNYLTKMDRIQVVFDSHFESMIRPAENYRFEDGKGYLNVRIHPSEDYFYLLQIASSEKGFIHRTERDLTYCDPETNKDIDPNSLNLDDEAKLRFVFRKKWEIFDRNAFRFGIQFGKVFNRVAFRVGIFEGFAGAGMDIDIPFPTDKFRWVTSFEAFDMSGWNRKDDRRPHLKWLNKMFILRNIYTTFGADDFASKRNASIFFGAGIRFGDDDVKYMLSSLSGAGAGLGGSSGCGPIVYD